MVAMTFVAAIPCLAQVETHRIVFVDKGSEPFVPGAPLYELTLQTFHADAIARRTLLGMDPVLTERDRPIPRAYLDELAAAGVSVHGISRWGGYVLADIDPATAAGLRAQTLRYARVEPVATTPYRTFIGATDDADLPVCTAPVYGPSLATSDLIGALPLHAAGVYGQGAVVGVIDNGFRWRTISGLQHVNVRGEFDVLYGDENTANEANDPPDQDGHGTLVLSILAGYLADSLVGVAPACCWPRPKTCDGNVASRKTNTPSPSNGWNATAHRSSRRRLATVDSTPLNGRPPMRSSTARPRRRPRP
jgi:serine protease AprX